MTTACMQDCLTCNYNKHKKIWVTLTPILSLSVKQNCCFWEVLDSPKYFISTLLSLYKILHISEYNQFKLKTIYNLSDPNFNLLECLGVSKLFLDFSLCNDILYYVIFWGFEVPMLRITLGPC